MTDTNFAAHFEAALADPQATKKIAKLTRQVIAQTEDNFGNNQPHAELLLKMGGYLADKPGETNLVLDAAKTAYNAARDDATQVQAAALWSSSFDRLKGDQHKIAELEQLQEVLVAGTPLENAYTQKWDALPDSKIKRDAVKTPEFYSGLREKMQEYKVSNIDRHLEEIEPLKYDTRGWSDFVSNAISMDNIGSAMARQAPLKPPAPAPYTPETEEAGLARLMARLKAEGIFRDDAAPKAEQPGKNWGDRAKADKSKPPSKS